MACGPPKSTPKFAAPDPSKLSAPGKDEMVVGFSSSLAVDEYVALTSNGHRSEPSRGNFLSDRLGA